MTFENFLGQQQENNAKQMRAIEHAHQKQITAYEEANRKQLIAYDVATTRIVQEIKQSNAELKDEVRHLA